MEMRDINVGLLGLGNIGAGVAQALARNGELIARRAGVRLRIVRAAELDAERAAASGVDPALVTADAEAVVRDPSVQVVVELIGGTGVARALILEALRLGKPVVTANKALLAEHGDELFAAAGAGGADVYFEASVGGGIPIIRALREGLVANRFDRIHGILNGTCNYILTRMEQEGLSFDRVLREAQKEGYAEAEPGLDIDGWDTAHKAVILAALAHGLPLNMEGVAVEGIRAVQAADLRGAAELGYRIKLLALIRRLPEGVSVRVGPTMVPRGHTLAAVGGVFNAVVVHGDVVGETLYYGRGAGRFPTASAVLGDLTDVGRRLQAGSLRRWAAPEPPERRARVTDGGDMMTRYYLRLSLRDRPGVLAQVAAALGGHGISIASVVQKDEPHKRFAPIIIVTHASPERAFRAALAEVDRLEAVVAPTVRYPIEDFAD